MALLDGLNPAQRDACESLDGPLLILAGAGSGKTRTLTHRVAHLLATGKARPQQVLTVTFTNKAAGELRERLDKLIPDGSGRKVWAMTFHALCVRVLRQSGSVIGYPSAFSIADSDDSRRLVKEALKEIQPHADIEPGEVRRIHSAISHAKNHLVTPQELSERFDESGFSQLAAKVWEGYQTRLQNMGAMDFDDLLLNTIKVLDTRPGQEAWAGRFRYILVDEYQDTNSAQYEILTRLCGDHRNLCVVGDDDQCQPGNTKVLTTSGPKRLDRLDPEKDRLLSYDLQGGPESLAVAEEFELAQRSYSGPMVRVSAGGFSTVCTPHHRWPVRYRGEHRLLPAVKIQPGMEAACVQNGQIEWLPVEAEGLDAATLGVWSLEVVPNHNYVADGLLTNNSIYAFRGAKVEHILRFSQDWPDAKVVKLEDNYRSSAAIIEAANAVIGKNVARSEKQLKATREQGSPVVLARHTTGWDEARWVADGVRELIRKGARPDQIALVYRNNSQSQELEEKLSERGIPYQVVGGVEFLRRAEVKTARAYLQLMDNPRDHLAFERAVKTPRRGVGDSSLAAFLAANSSGSLVEAAARADQIEGVSSKARVGLIEFGRLLTQAGQAPEKTPLSKLLAGLVRASGLAEHMTKQGKDGSDQLANVGALVSMSKRFDSLPWAQALTMFLEQTALSEATKEDSQSKVVLMTLHATKGLEFPYVFLCGMEEDMFFPREPDGKDLEEARRLLYVGITRAMTRLYICFAQRRRLWGQDRDCRPLRFLADLPSSVHQVSPPAARPPREGAPAPRSTARGSQQRRDHSYSQRPGRPPASAPRSASTAPRAARSQPAPAEAKPLAPGQKVLHDKFGRGIVVSWKPDKVRVRFGGGERDLIPAYARLQAVE